MYKSFLKRFVAEVRAFFTQQYAFALLIAVLVLCFQLNTGQISRSVLARNLWQVVIPYFVGLGLVVLALFLWTGYVMLRETYQSGKPSLTLTDMESGNPPVNKRTKWLVGITIAIVVTTP